MRVRSLAGASLLCSLAVTGCFNRAYRLPAHTYPSQDSTAAVTFVEADDRGNFWNAAQAEQTLELVRSTARSGPTVVVLFVHGWGHNASRDDQNLVCFANTLDYLGQRLNKGPMAKLAREQVARSSPVELAAVRTTAERSGEQPIHVLGIYVGWRGRSLGELPGFLSGFTRAFTFWGRKSTASLVGRGDLHGFVNTLATVYDSIHTPGPSGTADRPLFGLVSVGHSFGAQVLLPTVLERLQGQLLTQASDSAWRALRDLPVHWTTPSYVSGVGDLVVLVNPAVEASVYEPLYRLSKSLMFKPEQTPAIAVFSADNDFPRHWLFPIGRFFSTTFKARAGDKGWWEKEQVVIGRHDPQVTHRLSWEPESSAYLRPHTRLATSTQRSDNPFSQSRSDCALTDSDDKYGVDELANALQKDSTADVTAEWRINGKHLVTLGQHQPNEALMVVRTGSTKIIDNHNGFFTPEFVDFLVRYVTDIETKRGKTKAASRHIQEQLQRQER